MSGRRFELRRELGTGSFGTVYLADMVSLGGFRKPVALKLLHPQWGGGSDAGRRLRDEARLLGRLRHRNIVQVDDLVQIDGRWAVVMEHISGADAERFLVYLRAAGEDMPLHAVLEVIGAVATALDAAYHSASDDGPALHVVHRDIKPSNIRFTLDGEVKVLDFGIARASFEGREAKTERVRYGSIGYMSPERLLGDAETPAGDIFALGCVAYELLAVRPFGRVELSPEKADVQVREAVEALVERRPECRGGLQSLLRDMLSYEAEDRPTAPQVIDRVRRLIRGSEGDDLRTFCRSFLPRMADPSGTEGRLLQDILNEDVTDVSGAARTSGGTAGLDSGPGRQVHSPTLVASTDSLITAAPRPLHPPSSDTLPSTSRGPAGWIVGGVVALAVVGIGLRLLWPSLRGDGASTPSVAVTEPVTPAPSPSLPAEPLPAVPTTAASATTVAPPLAEPPPAADPRAPEQGAERGAEKKMPVKTTTSDSTASTSAGASAGGAATTTAPEAATSTVRGVKFVVESATAVSASCGSISGSGSTSAYLRDVPVGACTVRATIDGVPRTAAVSVDRPGGLTCALQGDQLQCQ